MILIIYRGSKDARNFHKKCNNKGEAITLIKNEKGNIFGVYASIPWKSCNSSHSNSDSFLFTLTNIHGTEPTKFQSKNDQKEMYHNSSYGNYIW